jgi:hypothetical protein
VPEHLRSDNGAEFVAWDLRKWFAGTGAKTAYIEPGRQWENGYFHYYTIRPHSSLGYRPPAPQAWVAKGLGCGEARIATLIPRPRTPSGSYLTSEIALRYTNNQPGTLQNSAALVLKKSSRVCAQLPVTVRIVSVTLRASSLRFSDDRKYRQRCDR